MSRRHNLVHLFVVSGMLMSFVPSLGAAVIEGRVELPPPERGGIPPSANRYETLIQKEVGPPGAPVAVVYLEGDFGNPAPDASGQAEMAQQNYRFRPSVLPVKAGTRVTFPNLDEDYHSIFSYSKAKRFDLGRYRKGEDPPAVVFDQAGEIRTYCEIHEHMEGTILVLDTPFFTTTDSEGHYRLENIPPGHYLLKVWLEEGKTQERSVSVEESQTVHLDFPAS